MYIAEAIIMTRSNNIILLIDDDPRHARALEKALISNEDAASNYEWIRTLAGGLERLAHKKVWAIILNLFLPDSQGIETLKKLLQVSSGASVIVLGGEDNEEICKEAMQQGAQDFLLEGHI